MGDLGESATGNEEKKVNLELSKCYLKNVNSASTLGSTFIQSDYFVSRDVQTKQNWPYDR